MGEERLVKAIFLMKITKIKKVIDEDNNEKLKVISENWIRARGKDFTNSLIDERSKGRNHTIKIVRAAPLNFQIGTIYILADGTRVWTFVEDSEE